MLAAMRAAAAEGRMYRVDTDVSRVGFCVRHFPFQEFRGEFTNIIGGLAFPPEPASYGQALLLISLPLWIVGGVAISWLTIAILLLAPTISALAQLALSRTREYNADLEAARLLGDPEPLALALAKIERFQGRLLEQFLGPGQRLPDPSMLRSHPSTEERIRRLVALRGHTDYLGSRLPSLVLGAGQTHGTFPLAPRPLRPRWHGLGTWY
jgi:heat shock protein HtpX